MSAGVAYADSDVQPPSVTFEHAVHLNAGEGSDLQLLSGTYGVERAKQERLGLVPGDSQPPIKIQAGTTTHEETISAPTALLIAEEGQEDEVHLVLLLPRRADPGCDEFRERRTLTSCVLTKDQSLPVQACGKPGQNSTFNIPGFTLIGSRDLAEIVDSE